MFIMLKINLKSFKYKFLIYNLIFNIINAFKDQVDKEN